MFTNKHIIIAMLVAPLLAILAYFATDLAIGEKPQPAVAGQNYKLAAGPDCRYASGKCTLRNGELTITMRATQDALQQWQFVANANQPLESLSMAIVPKGDSTTAPVVMANTGKTDEDMLSQWTVTLPDFDKELDQMRVVAVLGQSFYIVETPAIFPEFETIFSE